MTLAMALALRPLCFSYMTIFSSMNLPFFSFPLGLPNFTSLYPALSFPA